MAFLLVRPFVSTGQVVASIRFQAQKIELCSWARAAVVDAAVAASWTLGLASDRRRTAAAALALESTGSGGREHSFPSPKFKWRSWGRAALPL